MKQFQHIETLLQRYYEGCTSPAENDKLSEFFLNTPAAYLPEALKFEQTLFKSIAEIEKQEMLSPVPENLEQHLIEHINTLGKKSRSDRLKFIVRIAASIAVLITTITIVFNTNPSEDRINTTAMRHITTIEEASEYIALANNLLDKTLSQTKTSYQLAGTHLTKVRNKLNQLLNTTQQ